MGTFITDGSLRRKTMSAMKCASCTSWAVIKKRRSTRSSTATRARSSASRERRRLKRRKNDGSSLRSFGGARSLRQVLGGGNGSIEILRGVRLGQFDRHLKLHEETVSRQMCWKRHFTDDAHQAISSVFRSKTPLGTFRMSRWVIARAR